MLHTQAVTLRKSESPVATERKKLTTIIPDLHDDIFALTPAEQKDARGIIQESV